MAHPDGTRPSSSSAEAQARSGERRTASRTSWHVAGALVAAAAVAWLTLPEGPAALDDGLGMFSFQAPDQPALLVVRCGLVYFALSALRGAPLRAAAVAAAFVASLALQLAFYPFVAVTLVLAVTARSDTSRLAAVVLHGSLVLALAFVAAARLRAEPPGAPDPSPRAMVAYWRAEQNLYRARAAAIAWANMDPGGAGEGAIALAELDWQLGRRPQARAVLGHVLRHGQSAEVRARAEALRSQWAATAGVGAEP